MNGRRATASGTSGDALRGWILALAATVLWGVWSPSGAGRFSPDLRVAPAPPTVGEPFSLLLRGEWPDACVPELVASRIDASGGYEIRLQTQTRECAGDPRRYQLRVPVSGETFAEPSVLPVRVYLKSDREAVYRLFAFDLLAVGRDAPDFRPETGMWWPDTRGRHATSGPGVNFSFEFQGPRVAMLANLYDAYGNPSWMTASGQLEGRIVRADLLSLGGGQTLFGDYAAPDIAIEQARIYLHFHSSASATLWLSARMADDPRSELLLQPISLVRYVFGFGAGAAALVGRWVLLENGESLPLLLRADPAGRVGSQALVDDDRGLRLECGFDGGEVAQLPSSCRLLDAAGRQRAVFAEIGVNTMSGESPRGKVLALRLPTE